MLNATAANATPLGGGTSQSGPTNTATGTLNNPQNPLSPTSPPPNNHYLHHMNLDNKRDLTMIRAASTLLQELWDGKLKATLRSFVKKTAQGWLVKNTTISA